MRNGFGAYRASHLALVCVLALPASAYGLGQKRYVETTWDSGDDPGVIRAVGDLQADIARVTSVSPAIAHGRAGRPSGRVLIGTLGKSSCIDQLVREHKIDVAEIAGKWESFLIQVVPRPLPGIESALVIAGSDKRGTIYGIYDLSEQIGVSPWYWWADVPVKRSNALYIKPGRHIER